MCCIYVFEYSTCWTFNLFLKSIYDMTSFISSMFEYSIFRATIFSVYTRPALTVEPFKVIFQRLFMIWCLCFRQSLWDYVCKNKVPLESSRVLRYLQENERNESVGPISVLQCLVSGDVPASDFLRHPQKQWGTGHLPGWFQRHLTAYRRQCCVQHTRGSARRIQLRKQSCATG